MTRSWAASFGLFSLVSLTLSTKSPVEFVIDQFPPCVQPCQRAAVAEKFLRSDADIFGLCNDLELLEVLGPCEESCNFLDLQRISAVAGIYCASIGGAVQSFSPDLPRNGPTCVDNCTSTALAFGECEFNNTACQCQSSGYANSFGPCVTQTCPEEDLATIVAAGVSTCAPFGGAGPYNITDIIAYLEYTIPNFYPPVRIINSTRVATPFGTPVALKDEDWRKKNKGGGKEKGKEEKERGKEKEKERGEEKKRRKGKEYHDDK